MKPFKFKTLRSYIKSKCKESNADPKVPGELYIYPFESLQIANLIADDLFEVYMQAFPKTNVVEESNGSIPNAYTLFMVTGARRYLQRMKKEKKR